MAHMMQNNVSKVPKMKRRSPKLINIHDRRRHGATIVDLVFSMLYYLLFGLLTTKLS